MHRLLFLFCLPIALCAQNTPSKMDFAPCGTPPGISYWLQNYSQNTPFVADRNADTLYVGIQIHLLANDNGNGRFTTERLLDAFCRLNSDFEPANIHFFFKDSWNKINKTAWYDHQTIPEGINMMLSSNYPDVLNAYFVQNPAGNCGYNLPYGGVAINHTCANPNDHTWTHEVGHALSLPHPFIGWEGKTYSASSPTPLSLTYDYTYFHDTLETTVPAPLDTALVEFVDGSNCQVAADLFCDTKPDYLSYRWNCNSQNNSSFLLKDPIGAEFAVDGTLYMSYSADECQNRFSEAQMAAMRANLLSEKLAWLSNKPATPALATTTQLSFPPDQATLGVNQTELHWSKVPNAQFYHVLGSRISSFALRDIDVITTDTSLLTPPLALNRKYYWKVRPFNNYSTCAPYSPVWIFTTGATSAETTANPGMFTIYPTLLTPGALLTIQLKETQNESIQALLYNSLGVLQAQETIRIEQGLAYLHVPTLENGVFVLVLHHNNQVYSQRLVVCQN
ncbi:MAG: zinc-dependent metalloprotease [Bacteroidetes bacterium]|nr:zinc-dependent metalloprotease [Bacteroidota bacterium]